MQSYNHHRLSLSYYNLEGLLAYMTELPGDLPHMVKTSTVTRITAPIAAPIGPPRTVAVLSISPVSLQPVSQTRLVKYLMGGGGGKGDC